MVHNESPLERRYRGEHPVKTLLYFYGGEAHRLFLALFFYCIKHSGVWLLPLLTANIIDVISNPDTHTVNDLWLYGVILVFVYLQNVPTNYVYAHYISTANRIMENRLRSTLAWRLQHLSINFYARNSTGALQTKLLRDVEIIEQLTRQLFEIIPITTITMIIALSITAIRAPAFLLFFVVFVPVTVLVMRTMQTPIERRNRDFRHEIEGMSSRIVEMIHLIPVTRAHGIEEDELRRVDERLERVRHAGVRVDKMNALYGSIAWVMLQLANTMCLLTAATLAFNGTANISVGDVVMLTGYFNSLTAGISTIISLIPQIVKGFESVNSLAEVLQSPDLERNEGKIPVHTVSGQFKLDNVSFAYPDTDDSSLCDLNLDVQPGQTVAIVGASGAGKSTLLNLIIGFIRPSSGRILLDGKEMNDLDLRTYRHFLSVVPQSTVLFEGTIRDNILYGVGKVSESQLQRALIDANAKEFIDQLPDGLETRIGENGARLSGGQRQRIAIARALIRDPRVLILDEATSALDTASEAQIQEALSRLMKDRTTFVVAHRLSTIRNADKIVVLDKGQIVEVGTHDELLNRNGVYARLHNTRKRVS